MVRYDTARRKEGRVSRNQSFMDSSAHAFQRHRMCIRDSCYGYPGCPCCSPEPQTVTCPACKGTGEIYYNSDGERITKEEYDKLPADQRECDSCAESVSYTHLVLSIAGQRLAAQFQQYSLIFHLTAYLGCYTTRRYDFFQK